MAFEIKQLLLVNEGTIRKPRIEVFDTQGSTSFVISSSTFQLKNSKTGDLVVSGVASVNNNDTNVAGNPIKTLQCTLDLSTTDTAVEKGHYWLHFNFTLTNGETDVIRLPVEVVDYRES